MTPISMVSTKAVAICCALAPVASAGLAPSPQVKTTAIDAPMTTTHASAKTPSGAIGVSAASVPTWTTSVVDEPYTTIFKDLTHYRILECNDWVYQTAKYVPGEVKECGNRHSVTVIVPMLGTSTKNPKCYRRTTTKHGEYLATVPACRLITTHEQDGSPKTTSFIPEYINDDDFCDDGHFNASHPYQPHWPTMKCSDKHKHVTMTLQADTAHGGNETKTTTTEDANPTSTKA